MTPSPFLSLSLSLSSRSPSAAKPLRTHLVCLHCFCCSFFLPMERALGMSKIYLKFNFENCPHHTHITHSHEHARLKSILSLLFRCSSKSHRPLLNVQRVQMFNCKTETKTNYFQCAFLISICLNRLVAGKPHALAPHPTALPPPRAGLWLISHNVP